MPGNFRSLSFVVSGGGSAATGSARTPSNPAAPARVAPLTNSLRLQGRICIGPSSRLEADRALRGLMGDFSARLPRSPRQRKGEGRALAHLALDPDRAAVQLDELLGEREPEPR